jgi:hypothetical protein
MATWSVQKVQVDRSAATPEEPMTELAVAIQALHDAGETIFAVLQDVTDGSWVIISNI